MYAQSGHQPEVQGNLWDDEDMNGYQLLNEVGSGGTLSSLFTILSLFTEDIPMSWQDEFGDHVGVDENDVPPFLQESATPIRHKSHRLDSDISQFDLEQNHRLSEARQRRYSTSSHGTTSTVHGHESRPSHAGSTSPSLYDDAASHMPSIADTMGTPKQTRKGVVARAMVDTTLAVIPAEAFRRLTKRYPKATGHIVQGEQT